MTRKCLFITVLLLLAFKNLCCEIRSIEQIPQLRDRNLFVHYEFEKTEFMVAERINFKIWLENRSDETQYYQLEEIQEFVVADSNGRPLADPHNWPQAEYLNLGFIPEQGGCGWHAISAGERLPIMIANALEYYSEGRANWDFFRREGKYMFFGRGVASDTITFTIRKPSKQSERQISEELINFLSDDLDWTSSAKVISLYEHLLELDSSSVCVPQLLEDLIGWQVIGLTGGNDEKIQNYSIRLIKEFPNSMSVSRAIKALDISKLSSTDKREVHKGLVIARDRHDSSSRSRLLDSLIQATR